MIEENIDFTKYKYCECSEDCKSIILRIDKKCRPRRFANGHQNRGKNHPMFKGGRISDGYGYMIIWSPDHPNKNSKGYVREHILVMEKHLGRYLVKGEVVHHLNEIKDDNRIENLELIQNQSKHMSKHMIGNDNWKGNIKDMSKRFCLLCGSKTTYTSGKRRGWYKYENGFMCMKCYLNKRKVRLD